MLLVCKKKIGGNHAFSEIIKLQYGKKCHTLLCILLLFKIIEGLGGKRVKVMISPLQFKSL